MGKTMPHLDIICYQVKAPVPEMGDIFLSFWLMWSHRSPPKNHYQLLPRLLVTLHNLTLRPYC